MQQARYRHGWEKILVPGSDGDVFDRILNVIKYLGVSEVTEIKTNSAIQIGKLLIDSSQHAIKKG